MSRQLRPLLTGIVLAVCLALPASAQAEFGLRSLGAVARNQDGSVDVQAGSHPYGWTLSFEIEQDSEGNPEGTLREVFVELPAGMVGDPLALPRCTSAQFSGSQLPSVYCPANSAIGVATVRLGTSVTANLPVYNLTPPLGSPASIGFGGVGINALQQASLRSEGDYGVDIAAFAVPAAAAVASVSVTIWGVPGLASHDAERGSAAEGAEGGIIYPPVPFVGPVLPFFTLPTSCGAPLETTVRVNSVEEPTVSHSATVLSEQGGAPVGLSGCRREPFEPTAHVRATSAAADSPTGLEVDIHQPQDELPSGLSSAHLRDVSLSLPEGIVLNPSAATGLAACSQAEVGYRGSEGGALRFTGGPQACPEASKLGSVSVTSPLVDHPLGGALYLAAPFANPFGSQFALYLAVEDPQTGVIVKLAGRVEADPATGRISTVFNENPQLPIGDIDVRLFEGAGAALKTPLACGTTSSLTTLTPWSAPEGASVTLTEPSATTLPAPGAAACPGSEAAAPAALDFAAGTLSPQAASYAPFLLHLARADGTQHVTGIDTTLPEGLTGKLAGIPYCPEADIALARSREVPEAGGLEQTSPSCPAASRVGSVDVGAGAGPRPYHVGGQAYFAGPYRGAPLSLVVIVPAVAGPFDLGDVVTRVALYVDETTARIHAVSDSLPTIIAGVPLDIRSVDLRLDRDRFTLNPTSCDPTRITAAARTQPGGVVALSDRFQAGGCQSLAFGPKLALKLSGSTQRGKNPALKAVLTQPPGEANIARVAVTLPKSEFIDNRHINNPCTRVQFNAGAGNGAQCPPSSILGYARAFTPLLDRPLEGLVYFRSNGGERELPDIVASLDGQVHLNVVGFVDSVSSKGSEVSRVRNTFSLVPDAPVSRFVLSLKGGKAGLLQNSANLCKVENVATAKMVGQNGKTDEIDPKIQLAAANTVRVRRATRRAPARRRRRGPKTCGP